MGGLIYMKIKVTQKDIDLAIKYVWKHGVDNSELQCFCPLARAAKRAFRKSVSVYDTKIVVSTDESQDKIFTLTPRAKKFIKDFDKGLKVKPFTFVTEEK